MKTAPKVKVRVTSMEPELDDLAGNLTPNQMLHLSQKLARWSAQLVAVALEQGKISGDTQRN